MTILDIPEEWTLVTEIARKHGLAVHDVMELVECHSDIQLAGSGAEMMVCRLNP